MEENNYSEIEGYCCRNCGTVFYNNNSENNCVLCNNVLIEKKDLVLEKEKTYIISFEKSIDEAKKIYRRKVGFNPFVPFYFKRRKTIEKMKKLYIPCYFLDVNVTGSPLFLAMDKSPVVQDKKKMVESKKYELLFNTNFDYNDLVISKYSKIATLFETICKDGSNHITEFNLEIVSDIPIIYEDLSAEDVSNQLRDRILKSCLKTIRVNIPHELKKIEQNNMIIESKNVKKVLFPVYLLNIYYKDKNYYYLMNGDNGKAFAEISFGRLNIIIFGLFIFVIIFALALLIAYFL